MKKLIVLITISYLSLSTSPVHAQVQLSEFIRTSDLVIEGKVESKKSFYFGKYNEIYTTNKIKIYKILKGNYEDSWLEITTVGGKIEGKEQLCSHCFTLGENEEGILFLKAPISVVNNGKPNTFEVNLGDEGFVRYNKQKPNTIGFTPSKTYLDIEKEIFERIEQETGTPKRILSLTPQEKEIQKWLAEFNKTNEEKCIEYSFKNPTIKLSAATLNLEFDVYVKALTGSFDLYKSAISFEYDSSTFGTNLVNNNSIIVTKGSEFQSNNYSVLSSDLTSNKLLLSISSASPTSNLQTIGSFAKHLCHVKINLSTININSSIDINFDQELMEAESLYSDNGTISRFQCIRIDDSIKGEITNLVTPVITDFTPKVVTAGTFTEIVITGSNFGDDKGTVEFLNAFAGPPANEFFKTMKEDIISWKDDEIRVIVSSCGNQLTGSDNICEADRYYAGSGPIGVRKLGQSTTSYSNEVDPTNTLEVEYCLLNSSKDQKSIPVALFDRNDKGSYTITYDSEFNNNPNAPNASDAVDRAIVSWRCATGVNFIVNPNIPNTGMGNKCIIQFGDPDPNNTTVSARTTNQLAISSCIDNNVDQYKYQDVFLITFRESIGLLDINWETSETPNSSSFYNLENVALHELGHAHLIQHVNDELELMYYTSSSENNTITTVEPLNVEAGKYIVNLSTQEFPNCREPMIEVLENDCQGILNNLNEKEFTNYFSVTPNPYSKSFTIANNSIDKHHIDNLEILDILGRIIHTIDAPSSSPSSLNIPTDHWLPGIYFLRIKVDGKIQLIKTVKM